MYPRFVALWLVQLYQAEHDKVFRATWAFCGDRAITEDATQVEPAAPGPQGSRARRGCDRPVGHLGVAADRANARTRRARLCFVDESGVKLTPPVRRTWAPKGCTPVLRHRYQRGKQLSMCGLLAYRHSDADGEQLAAWMGFDLLKGAYDTRQCIRVLDGLATSSATNR